jgi:gas vesicle protein
MGNVTNNKTEKNDNPKIEHIRKNYYWRNAFFGLVILIAGIVIGGASMSILTTHRLTRPMRGREFNSLQVLPPLRRNLGLSKEQSEKIKPIIDENMKKLQELRENARSEIENTLRQMNEEISKILNDRQRRIWQRELGRLQRDVRPGGSRRDGMGAGARRGNESGGPRGGRRQRELLRRGPGPSATPPSKSVAEPNSLQSNIDKDKIENESSDSNMSK